MSAQEKNDNRATLLKLIRLKANFKSSKTLDISNENHQ